MPEIDFLSQVHSSTTRDYLARVAPDRAECARVMKQWGRDYWHGDRRFGYGGYVYDGRWAPVASQIAGHYDLRAGQRVLDVGCGMGHLLYELSLAVPGLEVTGLDVSRYAVEHAKPEIRERLEVGNAIELPYPDDRFDLVLSLNVLHNLRNFDLYAALREIERVSRGQSWICVESWRSEEEKANMLYWAVPCETFFDPEGWRWFFEHAGYTGDHGFIYFP